MSTKKIIITKITSLIIFGLLMSSNINLQLIVAKSLLSQNPVESLTISKALQNKNKYDTMSLEPKSIITKIASEKEQVSSDTNYMLTSYEDYVQHNFHTNTTISGEYSFESTFDLNIDNGTLINLPYAGNYTVYGEVNTLTSEYIQNFDAEEATAFYSNNANYWGPQLKRIEYNTSNAHVWKYYANISSYIQQTLYVDTLTFLSTRDLELSYDLMIEDNSTLITVENSSIVFDFVFDNCRIMIYNWIKSSVESPYGENETFPDVVFRISNNITNIALWQRFTLNITELLQEYNVPYPSQLNSFGIIIESPTPSKVSFLVDNISLTSEIQAKTIQLKFNGNEVNEKNTWSFFINSYNESINNICLIWFYNSNYIIKGTIFVSFNAIVTIPTIMTLAFNENMTFCTLLNTHLDENLTKLNVTHPAFWYFISINTGFEELATLNITRFSTLRIFSITGVSLLNITFCIPNLFSNVVFEKEIFETLSIAFETLLDPKDFDVLLFWWNNEINGSVTFHNVINTVEYTFPNYILNGFYNIAIVALLLNVVGYVSFDVILKRYPAEIVVTEELHLPKYGYMEVPLTYINLLNNNTIINATIIAFLDNETEIKTDFYDEKWFLSISAYYLSEGEHIIKIVGTSINCATVIKNIRLFIEEGIIDISYTFDISNVSPNYHFNFTLTSLSFPVAYAPLLINIDNNTFMGLTNKKGVFSVATNLSPSSTKIYIICNVLYGNKILLTKDFEVELETSKAFINWDKDPLIPNTNVSLVFSINYPFYNQRWYVDVEPFMLPILEAKIETEDFTLPVYYVNQKLYWDIPTGYSLDNHKLILVTTGISLNISIEEDSVPIIHFIFSSEKSFENITIIYYHNFTFNPSEYEWKLYSPNKLDITEKYSFSINSAYLLLKHVSILKNSYLIFDAVGSKTPTKDTNIKLILPILGAITAPVISFISLKIYKKKKSMILEI